MKKINLLFGAIALMLAMGVQSCGGGITGNSPGETVKKSFTLLGEKNYEKIAEMYVKKDGTAFTAEEKEKVLGLMTMAGAEITKKEGIKSIEIIEEKIAEDGTNANVKWKIVYGNGKEETNSGKLVKLGSDWKMVIGN